MEHKRKTGKIITVIIVILALILAAAVFLYYKGLIGNPVNKIAVYAVNTWEEFQLPEALDVSEYTSDGDYHLDISAETDMLDSDMEYDTDGETQQYILNNEIDLWFTSWDISTVCQIQEDRIRLQIPSLGDTVYCYNVPEEDSNNDGEDYLNGIAQMNIDSDADESISEFFLSHRFASAGKKDMLLGGETVSSRAYEVEVSGVELCELYESIMGSTPDEQEFPELFHEENPGEAFFDELREAGTVIFTVYCGRDVIAGIQVEIPDRELSYAIEADVLSDEERIDISCNSEPYTSIRYDTSEKALTAYFDGNTGECLRVKIEDGASDKLFILDGIESIALLAGGMDELESEETMLGMLLGDMLYESDIYLEIGISGESNIRTFTGREIEIEDMSSMDIGEIISNLLESYGYE